MVRQSDQGMNECAPTSRPVGAWVRASFKFTVTDHASSMLADYSMVLHSMAARNHAGWQLLGTSSSCMDDLQLI